MMTLAQHFLTHVHRRPDDPALCFRTQCWSYGELARLSSSLITQLQNHGIQSGDRCVVQLPNGPLFAALLLAASAMGVTLAPVATSLQPSGICRALERVGSHVFLTQSQNPVSGLPSEVQTVSLREEPPLSSEKALLQLARMADQADPDAPYILTLTSGSTGEPKPITLSQRTKLHRIFDGAVELYRLSQGERVLVASPMYHSLAMRLTLLPLVSGGMAIILPQFAPRAWLMAAKEYQATFTIAVSTHLERLLPLLETGERLPESLHTLVSSSALLAPDTKKAWLDHFAGRLHECYGASEIGIATNLDCNEAQDHVETVGRPLPYVDLKILDETGVPCPTGEVGEISVKTLTCFDGYYGLPELTEAAFTEDGYFLTGDLGRLDEAGYLYLAGRRKELIMVGGINVYPQDIEAVLQAIPGVMEAAVVGMEDADFGEKVVAFVVPMPDAVLGEGDLRRVCMQMLADFQQPRIFRFVDALPRNEVGKIQKQKLKAMLYE